MYDFNQVTRRRGFPGRFLHEGVASRPARGEIRVTLGDLVEAVADVTVDPAERAAVVDHILRTRSAMAQFRPEESSG